MINRIFKRPVGLLVLTLLLTLLAGCAGGDSLAVRLNQGDSVTYHAKADATFAVTNVKGPEEAAKLLPQDLKGQFNFEYDAKLKVETLTDKIATVSYEISNFKGEGTMGDQKIPLDGQVPVTTVTIKVNTQTGEIIEVTGLPELSTSGQAPGLDQEQLRNMVKQSFTQLPASGKAKVGDTWDLAGGLPLSVPNLKDQSNLKNTVKYEANETVNGVKVAKLVSTAKGPIDLTVEENGLKMTMKGTVDGKGTNLVDLKNGLPVTSDNTVIMQLNQSMAGQQPGLNLSMDLNLTMRVLVSQK